jgi:hypothetical protein
MANFAVDLEPYIPEGLELEDWARPARGRIIVSANPPRAHEEYAIITLVPPPPPQDLYEAMEEVVDFLVEERRAFVDSSCLSPLGLCLVQFPSPVTRQALINLSPLQLDANRQIIVQEHDCGLNLRSCPFSRTCWIMFLAFPLDYQTKEIISQAVGYFGSVITWTSNARCQSRILLRCKVSLISRIPRSLLICQGTTIGNHGSSWTVPVFVLSSNPTDDFPGDEDQIPPNGNPHPVNPHFLHQMNPQGENLGFFEDVGDLDNIQQDNIDQGWEVPQAGDQQDNMQGWGNGFSRKGSRLMRMFLLLLTSSLKLLCPMPLPMASCKPLTFLSTVLLSAVKQMCSSGPKDHLSLWNCLCLNLGVTEL